ncbi:MAG: hypothetical protein WC412_07710, partial [Candidatus Omnitrophota bacterium]
MINRKIKKNYFFRAISLAIIVCFLVTTVAPREVFAQALSAPQALVPLSPAFTPTLVRGIRVYPDNPLKFDFIVDSGDTGFKGPELQTESEKLIRYFLASLTLPEDELWVNLSPYEKDRIVPDKLGQTEMGRDMLAQDYLLKQITASLTNPDSDLGKEFWAKVYKEAYEQYGTTQIPVDTFNKVWIMPEKAEVYVQADKAFVVESRLKVMLEEDYLALANSGQRIADSNGKDLNAKRSTLVSDIVRDIFIPALEKEVNEGKNFAQLRQIYNSLILAYWYKTNLKNSILNKVYADKRKIKGIELGDSGQRIADSNDKNLNAKRSTLNANNPSPDTVQAIYQNYLSTFKNGVCNMMKVEYDPYAKKSVPRKYFAGGIEWKVSSAVTTTSSSAVGSAVINTLKKTALVSLITITLMLPGDKKSKPTSLGNIFTEEEMAHALYAAKEFPETMFFASSVDDLISTFGKENAIVILKIAAEKEPREAFIESEKLVSALGKENANSILRTAANADPFNIFIDQSNLKNHRLLGEDFWEDLKRRHPIEAFMAEEADPSENILIETSINIAAGRLLEMLKLPEMFPNTKNAVDLILEARALAGEKVIFGPGTHVINITSIEERFDSQKMKDFELAAGVAKENIQFLKGDRQSLKDSFFTAIETSRGPTTILYGGHGEKEYLHLAIFPNDLMIDYDELGDALIARGNIDEIVFLNFSCFSYNFIKNLEGYLKSKGEKFPLFMVSGANRDMLGPKTENDFFGLMKKNYTGGPVTIKHFLEAENKELFRFENPAFFYGINPAKFKALIKKYFPSIDIDKIDDIDMLEIGENRVVKPKDADIFEGPGYAAIGDRATKTVHLISAVPQAQPGASSTVLKFTPEVYKAIFDDANEQLKDLGVRLTFDVKTYDEGKKEKWIPYEAYGQATAEFKDGKVILPSPEERNGIVDLLVDPYTIDMVAVQSEEKKAVIPMGDINVLKHLYVSSLLNEMALFSTDFMRRGAFSPKAMMRFQRLTSLGMTPQEIADHFKAVTYKIEPLADTGATMFQETLKAYSNLDTQGMGLMRALAIRNGYDNDKYMHEKVSDVFTKEVAEDLRALEAMWGNLNYLEQGQQAIDSPYRSREAIEEKAKALREKYRAYKGFINKNDNVDLGLSLAVLNIDDRFIDPLLKRLSTTTAAPKKEMQEAVAVSSSIVIRPFDAKKLTVQEKSVFVEKIYNLNEEYFGGNEEFDKFEIESSLDDPNAKAFFAFDGEDIIGFAAYSLVDDGSIVDLDYLVYTDRLSYAKLAKAEIQAK